MKKLNYLSFWVLSASLSAETVPVVVDISETFAVTAVSTTSNVLPQLSFAAHQARAEALARQAENIIKLEEEKRIETEKLAQAQKRIQQEIGDNQLLLSPVVAKIYLENNFEPLWDDKNAQKVFLKEYAVFAASGVSVKSANALQQILNTSDDFVKDILLTDSFLDYLYYNKNVVKFANQWLYKLGSYTTKSPSEEQIFVWQQAIRNDSLSQYMIDLIPRNHIYQETVERLFISSPNENIKNESQKKNKKVSPSQTAHLGGVSFYKLALNTQRLRLIPSFNNGLFVNIPSYQLYYFRDGKVILQSKVIVGRDERRTPVMYSKLSNIVVNPPWNVPTSIKNKDLVPKMRQDPSYVERRGYEIIDSKGNKVNPYSINWAAYDNPTKNFPYHIRQKAGDDSALGRYKFNMPSSDAIYLHDTPNHSLFSKSNRALSSGCVRVAKSDELATLLLKEAGWSEERKRNVLASNKTTSAPIRSDNPVYLYYVTAWVENGKVYTLPDIYKYDVNSPKSILDWDKVKKLI